MSSEEPFLTSHSSSGPSGSPAARACPPSFPRKPRACGRHVRFAPSPSSLRWAAIRRMTLLLAAAGALLGGVMVASQDIVLAANSDGCITDREPGPPQNLKATPKDGRVILSWDGPRGGECVTTYVVNAYDAFVRSGVPSQSSSTSSRTSVVEGLTNGRSYNFVVQAYSSKFRSGEMAQVTAIPTDLCNLSERPGRPTNLRAQTGDGWARLCWDGVENDACVDQYRLSATLIDGPGFRSANNPGKSISRGGCANITGLNNGARYNLSVTPVSNRQGDGRPASVTALIGANTAQQNGWNCKNVDGCAPNRAGLCNTGGGCAAVARRGECRAPALYDVDWVNKQVTQWCGASCPCELGPAQGGSLMGVSRWTGASGLGALTGGLGGGFGAGSGGAGSGSSSSSNPFGFGTGLIGGSGGLSSSVYSPFAGLVGSGSSTGGGLGTGLANLGSGNGGALGGSSPSAGAIRPSFMFPTNAGSSTAISDGGNAPFGGLAGSNFGSGSLSAGSGFNNLFGGGATIAPAGGVSSPGSVTPGPVMAGAAGLGAALANSRTGQFMGNIANDMVTSGVVGEAVGKVAQQVIANQVNNRLTAMWGAMEGGSGAGGRRR